MRNSDLSRRCKFSGFLLFGLEGILDGAVGISSSDDSAYLHELSLTKGL